MKTYKSKEGVYYNLGDRDLRLLQEIAAKNLAISANAKAVLNFLDEKLPISQGYDAVFPKSMTTEEGKQMVEALVSKYGFEVAPNPTNGLVQFNLEGTDLENLSIVITDLQGKVIKSIIVDNQTVSYEFINVPHGIYLAHLVNNGQLDSTVKVVYVE